MTGDRRATIANYDRAAGPVACEACDLWELCRARRRGPEIPSCRDRRSGQTRRFAARACVLHTGRPAHAIYAVRHGAFKTIRVTPAGEERVVAFHLPGDVLGLEALATGRYRGDVIAMTPGSLCELPAPNLHRWLADMPSLVRPVLRLLSRLTTEAVGGPDHTRGPVLERVVGFLSDLSARLERRGFDGWQFALSMSRKDMASYLDTRIETISRTIKRLNADGRIHIRGRSVVLQP